jgi:hypothetical protein
LDDEQLRTVLRGWFDYVSYFVGQRNAKPGEIVCIQCILYTDVIQDDPVREECWKRIDRMMHEIQDQRFGRFKQDD